LTLALPHVSDRADHELPEKCQRFVMRRKVP